MGPDVPRSPPPADNPAPTQLRRPAPLPVLLARPLEPIYRAVIRRRNRSFDAGRGVTRFGVPVVSVGNLSVGGTGKSPMVIHIVASLLRAGLRPCIAMRGYSKSRAPASGHRAPDEADACLRAFPQVPVIARPDRATGIRTLLKRRDLDSRPNCVVLDDGFQHRRIARDLDIVLIDASRSPFRDRLLPAGWLREPVASLARASLVVLTHAELVDEPAIRELDAGIAAVRNGRGADSVTRHIWTGLWISHGSPGPRSTPDADRPAPLDWLLGKRIVASCAIGNPEGFLHSLRTSLHADTRRAGVLVDALVLPDHDPYHPQTVRSLARMVAHADADALVVTDKDWSKLRHFPPSAFDGRPIVRPQLALAFDRGQPAFDAAIISACRAGSTEPPAAAFDHPANRA